MPAKLVGSSCAGAVAATGAAGCVWFWACVDDCGAEELLAEFCALGGFCARATGAPKKIAAATAIAVARAQGKTHPRAACGAALPVASNINKHDRVKREQREQKYPKIALAPICAALGPVGLGIFFAEGLGYHDLVVAHGAAVFEHVALARKPALGAADLCEDGLAMRALLVLKRDYASAVIANKFHIL